VQYPSRLCANGNPEGAPSTSPSLRADSGALLSTVSDMKIAYVSRANVLIVGPEAQVNNALSLAVPDLTRDAVFQIRAGRLQLPAASTRSPTVVVRDLDTLTPVDQRRLLEWLDAGSTRTRVISTAAAPLLPLVEARCFNDTLYYRLNTVYIDLSE
jgi:hypothetical protein